VKTYNKSYLKVTRFCTFYFDN